MCFTVVSSVYHIAVNGQLEEDKTKAASDAGSKTKSAKTPESKPGKKRDRTPRKEIKVDIEVVCMSCWLVLIYNFFLL